MQARHATPSRRPVAYALAALFAVTATMVCLPAQATGAEAAKLDRIGRKIDAFSLDDYRGKRHSLADYADSKFVVVAFLGTECPLAKLYAPRLEELAAQYRDKGVTFLAVDSNQQDSLAEIGSFASRHSVTFPVLKDAGNRVADQFGAERTPEVFLLDADRAIRYRGRVDDQYGLGASSGYAKTKVERRDLAEALDELLAGKPVSQADVEAPGCIIGRVSKVDPHGEVTYSNQIARILQNRCVSCHRAGELAPFELTNYDEIVGWAEMICEVVDEGRMPPWFADPKHGKFKNDVRLTADEKQLFHDWVENGCPQGDAADLPEPRQFATGWQMGEPDEVIYMREEAYDVPAEGVVEYQYFSVDPGWKEDKWIQASEARPGNRGVVHHIIAFIQPPRRGGLAFGEDRSAGALAGYAPGEQARVFPDGEAQFVPAGSKVVFQMHYTPNGTAQSDRSYVGVRFADPATVRRKVRGGAAINRWFAIPPGDGNHEVKSDHTFGQDQLLTSLFPHMHLRGKSFRFEAEYPDGKREILLDVPHYDFNWQLRYELEEPKLMPKGTKLLCIAHFDNSEDNIANPDPTEKVRWGDQTWEEMMIGFFSSIPVQDDVNVPVAAGDGE